MCKHGSTDCHDQTSVNKGLRVAALGRWWSGLAVDAILILHLELPVRQHAHAVHIGQPELVPVHMSQQDTVEQ